MATVPTELAQIESPHFLDIRGDKRRTTLLCGGLPYHRRLGCESSIRCWSCKARRRGRSGWASVSTCRIPMAAALGFLSPPLMLPDQPPPPTPTGWFFHLDCRNVLATHWEPLSESDAWLASSGLRHDGPCRHPRAAIGNGRPRHATSTALLSPRGRRTKRSIPATSRRPNWPSRATPSIVPIGPHQWIEVEILFS